MVAANHFDDTRHVSIYIYIHNYICKLGWENFLESQQVITQVQECCGMYLHMDTWPPFPLAPSKVHEMGSTLPAILDVCPSKTDVQQLQGNSCEMVVATGQVAGNKIPLMWLDKPTVWNHSGKWFHGNESWRPLSQRNLFPRIFFGLRLVKI